MVSGAAIGLSTAIVVVGAPGCNFAGGCTGVCNPRPYDHEPSEGKEPDASLAHFDAGRPRDASIGDAPASPVDGAGDQSETGGDLGTDGLEAGGDAVEIGDVRESGDARRDGGVRDVGGGGGPLPAPALPRAWLRA
jgi:hypothetical protein